ncbi:domain of Kin17 curved DNA-binding protein-domain-containing protein [Corynascus novoguineensis]|uniref:Domain of Kin17 curved DNA-binding protein-domain-containing protein n=1 Tax=Corynascus novoguineensis TaxID=1126955 RepID=A0AAN7HTD4_9PEZI|nr:domain of Kin17 curved DNA-binding protein-domain-containing protein [Corynascus novoguineensis]
MGKAEPGSTKYLSNKMKQKGLTRLRWYCQICEKACRDENAFKMHCQSESHMRRALEAGQNFKAVQDDYSRQFLSEFVGLLKTAHGEKSVHANKFYQEVIARRDHVHLNATRWHSLTDFVKHISREGIVRAEEKEDGIFIAWIDDSPEAMRRREAVRRKEMQDKGDEEREQMMLREQIRRARKDAEARGLLGPDGEGGDDQGRAGKELKREEGEKIKLSFGAKPAAKSTTPSEGATPSPAADARDEAGGAAKDVEASSNGEAKEKDIKPVEPTTAAAAKPVPLKFGAKPQPKNVFKNAFAGAPKKVMAAQPKKMSEAERIMKEELERKEKRAREGAGGPPNKRPRF